jgi:hypothetical protein
MEPIHSAHASRIATIAVDTFAPILGVVNQKRILTPEL